jgi:hypothetical protein
MRAGRANRDQRQEREQGERVTHTVIIRGESKGKIKGR